MSFPRFSSNLVILQCLILGMLFLLMTPRSAVAFTSYSDVDLQYLVIRYQALRTTNIINEKQIDFAIDCFKNPSQEKLSYEINWAQSESIAIELDCSLIKAQGAVALAQKNFSKMRQALILSQPSKQLFMIPDGEIASESLDAELDLQINLNPFHPFGLTAPANWLKHVYDTSLFQLSTLEPVSESEKDFYRKLQDSYSRTFCSDFMENLASYTEKYKAVPGILENLIPWDHPLLSEKSLCESFLLKRISIFQRKDLSAREKKALQLLRKEYLKYSAQRRSDQRQAAVQDYTNLITASPLLLFMNSSHLTDQQWILALQKVKANADVRALVNLSEKDMLLVEHLSEDLKSIASLPRHLRIRLGDELRNLLQNPFGKDRALEVLRKQVPSLEGAHKSSAVKLQEKWDADYAFHRNVQMVIATGAMGVCFIPTGRLVGIATAAILKRGCMGLTGFPVNAYVFIHNLTRYEKRLSMLLSAYDESAVLVNMNLLNREKRAFVFASLLLPVGAEVRALGESSQLLLLKARSAF